MASLSSTFHHPCTIKLAKPTKPLSSQFHCVPLRLCSLKIPHYPSVSSTFTISARYVSDSGEEISREPMSNDDEALDFASIRSDNVRLIDKQQNMVGIVSKAEALKIAEYAELDLVVVSPDAEPPVVRLVDYTKYLYELQKKKREQQKKSAASRMDVKEIKMGYNIDSHDYSVRLRAAQKFLKDGDKVKVIVNLKGRQNEFRNNAIELIRRFQNDIGELAIEEAKNFREKNIFILLLPNKALKAQPPPKKNVPSVADEVSAGV